MNQRTTRRGVLLLLALAVLLPVAGCGYGEVSGAAYDYATALYSITNRRLEAKLDDVDAQITAAADSGEITQEESRWLRDIVSDARAGDWEGANRAARRMMEDQVKRAKG